MTLKLLSRLVLPPFAIILVALSFWAAPNGLGQGGLLAPSTVADIAQAASPAVVNIEIDQPGTAPSIPLFPFFGNIPDNPTFEFFFNGERVRPPKTGEANPPLSVRKRHNMGSGFIIRADGYILTNNHVVNHASEIKVTLGDKRVFKNAKIIGTDRFTDLAVIKIDATNLPTLKLGQSANLRPGEFSIAIGNPVGLDHTVTFGIISAVARDVRNVNRNINFIQTDAAINPGNSGGPLLNLDGEVIGVNTAIQANAQSIGFSIPIDVAKTVVDALIAGTPISRPYLGIIMQTLDENMSKNLGLPAETHGVYVSTVFADSPAFASGLQAGDIIQKIDGKEVLTNKDVQEIVHLHKAKDTLSLNLLHNKIGKNLSVSIGEYPNSALDPGQLFSEEE